MESPSSFCRFGGCSIEEETLTDSAARDEKDVRWKELRRTVRGYILAGIARCLSVLPYSVSYMLGGLLGLAAYGLVRRERVRTIRHLTEFFGSERSRKDIRRLARGVFRHFGHSTAELLALRDPDKLFARLAVSLEGLEYLDQTCQEGRGVVFVSGHFGNWELMGAYLAYRGYPIHAVAREPRQPVLREMIEEYRSRVGLRVYYTNGNRALPMVRALRRGEILGLLIDIRTEGQGRWVEFLGRPAYTLAGPASLVAGTGARLIYGYSVRTGPRAYRFVIQPPLQIDVPAARSGPEWDDYVGRVLTSLNSRLSTVIEQFPEQWMWMHRRHEPVRRTRRK